LASTLPLARFALGPARLALQGVRFAYRRGVTFLGGTHAADGDHPAWHSAFSAS
jgi:hypothetical protein